MALPPTTGEPLNLYVPPFDYGVNPGDDTWDVPANDNWNIINSFAQTVVLYNPTGSQTIAQPSATFLNFDKAIAYDGALRFGTAANLWDSALSRSGAGAFTLDSNTIGNAAATLKLNVLNAVTGLQINSAAPLNHVPVGDGTHYVDAAQIPTSAANYQKAEFNAGPLTGRNIFNVLTPLTAVDDSGNASTDIGHRTSPVSPSNYTSANITIDAWGHVIAAANGLGGALSSANVAVGYAAGAGATATVTGSDGNHQVALTVANTGAPGTLFTVTFTTSRGHVTYPIVQALATPVDARPTTSTSTMYSVVTTDSLAPSTYLFNISCP